MSDSAAKGEWWFYHLENTSLEHALGPLLEKCLANNWRVLIVCGEDRQRKLDVGLWTWKDESFLPHGRSDFEPTRQPILLHQEADPLNDANVVMLLDGADADASQFERCMVVFEGDDADTRNKARQQFKTAKDAGMVTKYFQQTERGGWEQKA
jgi:DNA polymerase-3 subunit chi